MNDLPTVYRPGYTTARKQPYGWYKLYWIGTSNEIFPGELFRTPTEAKQYYQVQIIKQAQRTQGAQS